MLTSFVNFLSYLKRNNTRILSIVVLILCVLFVLSTLRCSYNADKAIRLQQGISYLNDTLTRYEDKLNRETVSRGLLVAEKIELKRVNKSLYDELKVERKTQFITRTNVKYKTDTLYRDSSTSFVVVNDSMLADINIDLGTIIVGYDKNRKLFAKSSNRDVTIDTLEGVLLTDKPRRLGVGLFAGAAMQYGVLRGGVDFGLSVGIGLTWRLKK